MSWKRSALLMCCTAIFAFSSEFAAADRGGRGRAITPYRDIDADTKEIKLKRIQCEMRRTNVGRAIENFRVDWPSKFRGGVEYAGMAFVDMARAQDKKDVEYAVTVFHYFEGNDPAGKTVRVEFNRVEFLEILATDGKTARIKLTVFPTIDAKALTKTNIKYTALKKYTKDVTLTVATKNAKGEDLAVVALDGTFGEDCDEADNSDGAEAMKPIATQMQAVRFHAAQQDEKPYIKDYARFADLSRTYYELTFVSRDIWWAVPSVIDDRNYPYCRKVKK